MPPFALLCRIASDNRTGAAALTAWSRERMANYKVPREIVVVDELPRGSTGKVLRGGLHSVPEPALEALRGLTRHRLAHQVVEPDLRSRPR